MPRIVTFVVDPTMYGDGSEFPRDVYGDLDRVVRPDLHYHYSTPVCAQRWLDVCDDPAYGHRALLEAVTGVMPEVAAALLAASAGRRRLSLCSLGPGDGSVDERMLVGLAPAFAGVSYTGLDFSFELLRRSVRRLASAPALPEDLSIAAVCGDFTGVRSLPVSRDPRALRLFALTGFTFGNYPEAALLRDISALMGEGDHLFLDTRLHPFGPLPDDMEAFARDRRDLLASYDLESVRRFVFGPVEVATTALASDVRIGFELARSLTAVPNALNLVIHCTGLDTTLRLTGAQVRRERLDLAVTTSYHLPDLEAWLGRSGLATVWRGTADGIAFFLLRK
ncbi:MAG: L-histidine N(alpha)-methyltransferase [Gemmatimonadetes bacterium]|nr:L-histidine N(alpha)-methyltransferase [Gemmatimonadota bacterium]